MENSEQKIQSSYLVPASIIIAGAIIAGALYFKDAPARTAIKEQKDSTKEISELLLAIPPLSPADHQLGNPNASVKLITYTDLECPFCKQFHLTIKQLLATAGIDGSLAVAYRSFPLESLHTKAVNEAHASECVASLIGNDGYWKFIDKLFATTPSNDGLDPALLENFASFAGADKALFNACQDSGKFIEKISKESAEAVASGGEGTPWSMLITKSGKRVPVSGSLPLAQMKLLIEKAGNK